LILTMASADGNLAATYTLIHAFLLEKSHEKVAKALKKAVKDVVILRDEVPTDSPPLNEIIAQWKTWRESKTRAHSSSSSSDSSDSSDSSSSNDSGTSGSSSGSSDSSSSEDNSSSESPDSSDSSSESEEDPPRAGLGFSSKSITQKRPVKKGKKSGKVKPPSSSNKESSSEASESTPKENGEGKTKAINGSSESKAVDKAAAPVPMSKIDDARVTATKRRRTSLDGSGVATAITVDRPKGHEKERRKNNVPFQRIKADDVTYHDDRLKDNTFVARNGAVNDYGAKAHRDLIVTRGDGFRKEKNKKKRGSYRGGEITMESHSIKFA